MSERAERQGSGTHSHQKGRQPGSACPEVIGHLAAVASLYGRDAANSAAEILGQASRGVSRVDDLRGNLLTREDADEICLRIVVKMVLRLVDEQDWLDLPG